MFPTMNRIDNHHVVQHEFISEEFQYEEAIFHELIRKKFTGQNALSMAMKVDRAREQQAS